MRIGVTVDPEIPVPPKLYGGIERIVELLVCGLVRRGHEVTLFAHRDSSTCARLVPYPGQHSGSRTDTLKHMRLVWREARRAQLQVIHSFGRLAYVLPSLLGGIPVLMTYQRDVSPRSVRWGRRIGRGRLHFSAISRSMLGRVGSLAPWHVVPNCASPARYTFERSVPQDAPLVFLGRIEHIKGTHLAIEVARRARRRLVIAGNVSPGEEHRRYFEERIAPHLDGKLVRYIGPADDETKNALLGAAAALLMPVLWSEPFGIVMVEALACGTPVIGLRSGSVPEVVEHGVTGFVCGDVDEMVAAVARVDQIDRSACRRELEQRFSDGVVVDSYLGLYREIVDRAPGRGP